MKFHKILNTTLLILVTLFLPELYGFQRSRHWMEFHNKGTIFCAPSQHNAIRVDKEEWQ